MELKSRLEAKLERRKPSPPPAERAKYEPEPGDYAPPAVGKGTPMAGLLQNVIGGMDAGNQIHESLALAYWPKAVGAQAAAATEADTVRDGVLFIRTKSSVWSHELTLHKSRLLLNLNRMMGGKVIHDIIFRAQGLNRQMPTVEKDAPDPDELAAVALEADEKAELRDRLCQLVSITDERIRKAIATRLTNEAKLRHWRLERGWKLCPRCSAAYKTDHFLCPICRLKD